jgi:hypothetical protein
VSALRFSMLWVMLCNFPSACLASATLFNLIPSDLTCRQGGQCNVIQQPKRACRHPWPPGAALAHDGKSIGQIGRKQQRERKVKCGRRVDKLGGQPSYLGKSPSDLPHLAVTTNIKHQTRAKQTTLVQWGNGNPSGRRQPSSVHNHTLTLTNNRSASYKVWQHSGRLRVRVPFGSASFFPLAPFCFSVEPTAI